MFIDYFPDYLSALSRTLLCLFGQPLSKQLYTKEGIFKVKDGIKKKEHKIETRNYKMQKT